MLELKQEQKLAPILTQRLQQAIKLLQLSRLELKQAIEQELKENPVLEIEEAEEEKREEELQDEEMIELLQRYSPSEDYFEFEEREFPEYERAGRRNQSLKDYLRWQVSLSEFDGVERQVAEWVIESLDENGYLISSPEEIASYSGFELDVVKRTIEKMKRLDPPGVCARDLKECILLQYYASDDRDPLFELVLKRYFDLLKDGKLQDIAKKTGISLKKLKEIYERLKGFDPKPGRNFADESTVYVVPDVYVVKKDDGFEVVLNDDEIPELRISRDYVNLYMDSKTDPSTKKFIKAKIKQAEWFIRSIEQRKKTLLNVAKCIVKFQEDFFRKGPRYLKPLTLREVADELGYHESTISRITTNKYMGTPYGTFEMKFFFPQGVDRLGGDSISTETVMNLIKDLIQKEDKRRPLTDDEIARILKERFGIKIARRTVVKYREELGIFSSRKRRERV